MQSPCLCLINGVKVTIWTLWLTPDQWRGPWKISFAELWACYGESRAVESETRAHYISLQLWDKLYFSVTTIVLHYQDRLLVTGESLCPYLHKWRQSWTTVTCQSMASSAAALALGKETSAEVMAANMSALKSTASHWDLHPSGCQYCLTPFLK